MEFSADNQYDYKMNTPYTISGQRITVLVYNGHRLLGKKRRRSPLWTIVSDLTGHGSTVSAQICHQAGFDAYQPCSNKILKPYIKSVKADTIYEETALNS